MRKRDKHNSVQFILDKNSKCSSQLSTLNVGACSFSGGKGLMPYYYCIMECPTLESCEQEDRLKISSGDGEYNL